MLIVPAAGSATTALRTPGTPPDAREPVMSTTELRVEAGWAVMGIDFEAVLEHYFGDHYRDLDAASAAAAPGKAGKPLRARAVAADLPCRNAAEGAHAYRRWSMDCELTPCIEPRDAARQVRHPSRALEGKVAASSGRLSRAPNHSPDRSTGCELPCSQRCLFTEASPWTLIHTTMSTTRSRER